MATDAEGKKLSDLRVVDLRAELEKRGMDKTGVKAALLERLQKALISEGKDPDEYEFELNDKKPVKRLSTSTRQDDTESNAEQNVNDSNVLMIETPSLEQEAEKETNQEEDTKEHDKSESDHKNESGNAESPLNISIGEEEELLNSGDEQEQSIDTSKTEDEKTATNQHGGTTDDSKELDSTTEKPDEDKEEEHDDTTNIEDSAENREQDADDEKIEDAGDHTEETKKDDSPAATNDDGATATAPPASANGTTVASEKESSKSEKDKDKDKNNKGNPGRSLWVTNLLPSTRAQELKHLLSKYGKVIGAKVVQSSRYPRQRCYGYVTMETRAAADLCIEKLNNTELKGQIIRVAKVRPEHSLPMSKAQKKDDSADNDKKKKSPPKSGKSDSRKSPDKKKSESSDKKKDESKKDNKDDRDRSRHNSRGSSSRKNRSLSKSSGTRGDRKTDILTFDKIREERERQRQRERDRVIREQDKRRREIAARAREIEKRQREEAMRLEREREKLRIERERLDRQRAEIMRLERERQRLEREKLEQEKQELRRAQMKLEEARRPVKRPSSSSTSSYRREGGSYSDDRKRMVTERHYDETPPPPRFEVTNRDSAPEISKSKEIPKDYKSRLAYSSKRAEEYAQKRGSGTEFKREYPPTERHSGGHPSHIVHSIGSNANSSKYESSAYVNREREREMRDPTRRETIVPNVPPPRISKDARYAERSGERSPVYRTVRDERERRTVSDHHSSKSEMRSSREHRYPEAAMKEGARYREGGNSWHSTAVKPFSGLGSSTTSSRDSWSKTDAWRPMESNSNERWGNSSSRILMSGTSGVPNSIFSGGSSNMGIGSSLSCPPPPGNSSYSMDRFDASFKSLNSTRKY